MYISGYIHTLKEYNWLLHKIGQEDPCIKKKCSFGAICQRSMDGLSAQCVCQSICENFGDSDGGQPVCGSDGKDYDSLCHLNRDACIGMKSTTVVKVGKCST